MYVSRIEDYSGKGNVKSNKFKIYITSIQKRGYSVAFQGDRNGGKKDRFKNLVNDGLVDNESVFLFSKDFEGSFPPIVLHYALKFL
jgi:hypothetical protein